MNHANLWAPWRMAYLRSIADLPKDQQDAPKDSNFFRTYWASPQDDELNLVVHRTDHGMILLNRYPYSNGHLLIALGEAAPRLSRYSPSMPEHITCTAHAWSNGAMEPHQLRACPPRTGSR